MTQTQTQSSVEATVQSYFDIWNQTDPEKRRALLHQTWSEDAYYVDPMFVADGAEQLDALVVGLHQNYPGHYFRRTGTVDSHHDRARWAWEFLGPDDKLVMSGIDVGLLSSDGKLREVTGFFQPPA